MTQFKSTVRHIMIPYDIISIPPASFNSFNNCSPLINTENSLKALLKVTQNLLTLIGQIQNVLAKRKEHRIVHIDIEQET